MKRIALWMSFGVFGAALGGTSFGCGSDSSGGSGGKGGSGGSLLDGGGTGGTSATGGTGAIGGTGAGGSGGQQSGLGRACVTDAECGQNLICAKADSGLFGGEGPAKGYCTADCSADETICDQFAVSGSSPRCAVVNDDGTAAFCFEGCSFGPDGLTQLDPDKCHGRPEVACAPLTENGAFTAAACLPQCNLDADCGSGLFCNPATGGCSTTAKTGTQLGDNCVQPAQDSGTPDPCRGNCTGFVHSNTDVDPFTYMCTENCTFGAPAGCGWEGPTSGPAPAVCGFFFSTIIFDNGGPGLGDRSSCAQLCDDNCGCGNTQFVCEAWSGPNAQSNKDYTGRNGICLDPLQADGGMSPGIACGSTDSGTGGGAGASGDAATD